MVFGQGGFDDAQARRDEELRREREEQERFEREDRERQELEDEQRRRAEEYPAHQKHAQRATDGTFQERFEALESPERLTLRRDRDWVEDDEAGVRARVELRDGSADAKELARVRPGAEHPADADDGGNTDSWDEQLEAMRREEEELAARRAALNPRRKVSDGLDDEEDEDDSAAGSSDDDFSDTGGGSSPTAAIVALLFVVIGAAAFYLGWYLPSQRNHQAESQPQSTQLSSAELPLAERGADLSNPLDAASPEPSEINPAVETGRVKLESGMPDEVSAEDFLASPQRAPYRSDIHTEAEADDAGPAVMFNDPDFLGSVPNTAAVADGHISDDTAGTPDAESLAQKIAQSSDVEEPPASSNISAFDAAPAQPNPADQERLQQLTARVAALETRLGELASRPHVGPGTRARPIQSAAARQVAPRTPSAKSTPETPTRLTDDNGVQPVLLSIDAWGDEPSVLVGTTAPGDKRVRVMRAGDTYNGIHLDSIGSDGTSAVFTASGGVRVTLNLNQRERHP